VYIDGFLMVGWLLSLFPDYLSIPHFVLKISDLMKVLMKMIFHRMYVAAPTTLMVFGPVAGLVGVVLSRILSSLWDPCRVGGQDGEDLSTLPP